MSLRIQTMSFRIHSIIHKIWITTIWSVVNITWSYVSFEVDNFNKRFVNMPFYLIYVLLVGPKSTTLRISYNKLNVHFVIRLWNIFIIVYYVHNIPCSGFELIVLSFMTVKKDNSIPRNYDNDKDWFPILMVVYFDIGAFAAKFAMKLYDECT